MENFKHFTDIIDNNDVDYDSLLPLYYNFDFNDLPFECQILADNNKNSYIVNLTADLGYLPYSCENKNKRHKILKNFQNLMSHNLIIIDHHCNMTFPINTSIKGDLSAKRMMEAILYTLLDVQEVLSIISSTLQKPNFANQQQA